jgi:hypothetical protein
MPDFSLMRLFFIDFFQSLANFPAKGLLAREALENCHFSLLFVILFLFPSTLLLRV